MMNFIQKTFGTSAIPGGSVIVLHSDPPSQYSFKAEESKYAEELCSEIAQKVGFNAVSVPLFQIGYFVSGENPKIVWMNPKEKLNEEKAFYFRLRFFPQNENISSFFKHDKKAAVYLYQQCHDDFVSGRINEYWNKKSLLENDFQNGLTAMDLLMKYCEHGEETSKDLDLFLKEIQIENYLSPNTLENLNWISKLKLRGKIKRYLKMNCNRAQSQENLKGSYIKELLLKVPDYYTEVYHCEEMLVVSINLITYPIESQPDPPKPKVETGLYINSVRYF